MSGTNELNGIERVGVIGAGLMGSGIAEVCARAGRQVLVLEISPEACERGRSRLVTSLDRGVRSGKLAEEARDEAIANLWRSPPTTPTSPTASWSWRR